MGIRAPSWAGGSPIWGFGQRRGELGGGQRAEAAVTQESQGQGRNPSCGPLCDGQVPPRPRVGKRACPHPSLVALGKPLLSSGPQREVLPHLSSVWLGATYLGQAAEPSSLAPGHHRAAHPPARAADGLGPHPKRLQAAGQDFHSPHVSEGICPVCPRRALGSRGTVGLLPDISASGQLRTPVHTCHPFVLEACRNCSTRRGSVVLAAPGLERQLGWVRGALVSLGSPGEGGPVHLPGPRP